MKALVKYAKGPGNLEIRDVPEPEVSGDLVKIKVVYCGICGTDLHTWQGEYGANKPPVTLGHEFSGIVADVGPDVKNLHIGDRVTSETTFETCGHCIYCLDEEYNLCSERRGLGTQVDGGFAEYVINHEARIHRLPDNVSLLDGAMTEPLSCVTHAAMETSVVCEGENILIFGPGAMGLLTGMVGKALGARVILAGIDKDAERFELAEELGFDRVVNQTTEDLDSILADMTDGYGPEKIFECSGSVRALNRAFELIHKKGEIIQLGLFAKDNNEIDTMLQFQREIRYLGTRTSKPSSWIKALDLMARGLVKPSELVSMITPLDNWEEGFMRSKNADEVKVILQISDPDEN